MRKLGAIHHTLDQKVYDAVKSMIIERQIEPGAKILQDKLADQLGVSRTPLVNALKKLEHEKLIMALPRRGFYVRIFSKEEMLDIFELREVLEGLAARRAALYSSVEQLERFQRFVDKLQEAVEAGDLKTYADEDRHFHKFLVEIGGKEFLAGIIQTYNIVTFSYQFQDQEGLVRPPEETMDEHRMIVEAICQHDPARAEELMRLHLSKSATRLIQELETEQGV